MRKINLKFFLALMLFVTLLAGSVAGVHFFQRQRIAVALLWQAGRAEEEGQPSDAARYLTRYLEFNPRDLAEKANLARVWATDPAAPPRRKAEAVRLLDEVLTYEDSPELRRLLVRTAVEAGNWGRAKEHLGQLLRWQELEDWLVKDSRADRKSTRLNSSH